MITVFGSLNADLVCPVEHLPAPGETVTGPGYSVVPGGKGANQALAAALAGAPVRFVGAVGRDGFREPALSSLKTGGVDLSALADSDRQTACAFIGVDPKGENQIIVASGANLDARAAQLEVVDTTAAGDAFVGGFAAALHRGAPMDAALAQGIVAGGLACRKLGAQSSLPTAAEIAETLTRYRA